MDRIRFHQGANKNQEQRHGQNNINQSDVHDMYKSFSSADRIHFFEDQRRSQNLVGDFEDEDADAVDQRRELSANGDNLKDWNIDKERIGASGGSAGACSSLWHAFHDDLADPKW